MKEGINIITYTRERGRWVGLYNSFVNRDKMACLGWDRNNSYTAESRDVHNATDNDYSSIITLTSEENAKVKDFIFSLVDKRAERQKIENQIKELQNKLKELES